MEKFKTFLPKSYGKYFAKHCVVLNRMSFLDSVDSKTLFLSPSLYIPSFHTRNVSIFITFLSVSCLKLATFLVSNHLHSVMLLHFFLFFFFLCDFFLEVMACSESLLMLERKIEQKKNLILPSFTLCVPGVFSYFSFSQTCESLPRAYLCFLL